MMFQVPWLWRIVGGVGAFFAAALAIYTRGRQDARASIEGKATKDALNRTQAAVRAGDAVNSSPGRLRDSDGHRRD